MSEEIMDSTAPRRGRPPMAGRHAQGEEQRSDQREPVRGAERLQRVKNRDDRYSIDPSRIPRGMTYQWVAQSVLGDKDVTRGQYIDQMQQHWKPVPANRHPEVFGFDAGEEAGVIRGLVLCERPDYLTQEAETENRQAAKAQVATQMARIQGAPEGTLERRDAAGRPMVRVTRTFDNAIPEDAE